MPRPSASSGNVTWIQSGSSGLGKRPLGSESRPSTLHAEPGVGRLDLGEVDVPGPARGEAELEDLGRGVGEHRLRRWHDDVDAERGGLRRRGEPVEPDLERPERREARSRRRSCRGGRAPVGGRGAAGPWRDRRRGPPRRAAGRRSSSGRGPRPRRRRSRRARRGSARSAGASRAATRRAAGTTPSRGSPAPPTGRGPPRSDRRRSRSTRPTSPARGPSR